MFRKRSLPIFSLLAALSLSMLPLAGQGSRVSAADTAPRHETASPVTVITVDSGTDPDTSKSKTCVSDTPCTLRRAIVQARGLSAAERPVLIQFDIPQDAHEGYDSTLGIWKIQVQSTSDPSVFRSLDGGQVTIDGSTQPGGATSGPKIFIVGPSTGSRDGLLVGANAAGGHDGNTIRGLAFQNFKTHLTVNSNDNLIEDNWFGLSDDGTTPYLRNDDPQDGSGSAGVALSAGVSGNTIQNNIFLGFDGVAAALRGDDNTFTGNYVGTPADGIIRGKQSDPSLICTSVDWLGGGGISMEGNNHTITNNVFAGLRQEIFHISTQPDAIRVTGTGHLIANNQIGVDAADVQVGVCGRGVYLSDSPKKVQVTGNTIANSGLSGISLNGALYDENTLRSNLIIQEADWPFVQGSLKGEDAIQLGPGLPDDFEHFRPAEVLSIDGTTVSGSSGTNSPCPNCTIEIFLDDTDAVTETLQVLTTAVADANGNWSATLPFELSASQGLRTTSTTAQYNTIPYMHAGTTTGLSTLYVSGYEIYLPLILRGQ